VALIFAVLIGVTGILTLGMPKTQVWKLHSKFTSFMFKTQVPFGPVFDAAGRLNVDARYVFSVSNQLSRAFEVTRAGGVSKEGAAWSAKVNWRRTGADTGEIIVQAIGKPIPERVFCCVRDPSTPFARFLQRAERLGQRWNIPVDSLTSILSTKIWTDFDPNEALQREFRPRR